MNKYTFTDNNGAKWERVTKPTAKKNFVAGNNVILTPCKTCPFTFLSSSYIANYEELEKNSELEGLTLADAFNAIIQEFLYYECQYEDMGKYPAFYIKKEGATA